MYRWACLCGYTSLKNCDQQHKPLCVCVLVFYSLNPAAAHREHYSCLCVNFTWKISSFALLFIHLFATFNSLRLNNMQVGKRMKRYTEIKRINTGMFIFLWMRVAYFNIASKNSIYVQYDFERNHDHSFTNVIYECITNKKRGHHIYMRRRLWFR